MDHLEIVLTDYRNAGVDLRLSMFLEYRDLRDRFTCIDTERQTEDSKQVSSAMQD